MRILWFLVLGGLAASACEANTLPGPQPTGATSTTGQGASGPVGTGSGADESVGGNSGPPVFELTCNGNACDEGSVCCVEGGGAQDCAADPGMCLEVAAQCDDQEDCEALMIQGVCCAFYEVVDLESVLTGVSCTSKGTCSGPGTARVCDGTDYCPDCAPAVDAPNGLDLSTCSPPSM
jgi:hypothetical protein